MDDEFLTLDQIDSLNHVDLTNTDAIGSLSLDESPTIALDAKHVGEIRAYKESLRHCFSSSQPHKKTIEILFAASMLRCSA
jgi:hypothetical protein